MLLDGQLQLRHPNPDKVLTDRAVAKARSHEYRPDYLRNHDKAFLPLIMSTSGRLHSEYVRLLYILAHRRAVRFFATLDHEPSLATRKCVSDMHEPETRTVLTHPSLSNMCQRRGAFFIQHRARIGLAGAQAAALRMGGNTLITLGLPRTLAGSRSSPLTHHFTCLPSPTMIYFLLPLLGFMALSLFLFLFLFCFLFSCIGCSCSAP